MQRIIPTRTFLFINSKNRIYGNPYDFVVNLNNELVKSPKNHYTQITVEQVSITRTWYSIQNGFNTFNIVDNNNNVTTITISVGHYNAFDLRSELQQLMPTWTITYNKKLNIFNFTRPINAVSSYRFVFPHYVVAELLGFSVSEQPSFTSGSPTTTSSKSIKVNNDASLFIHSSIPRQKFSAIDNIEPTFKESDVLCSIPITAAPFDNIVFNKSNGVEFKYNVFAPAIHQMRFYLTNEQGLSLQVQHDWEIILSVVYVPFDDNMTNKTLIDIKDMIKLFMLQNIDLPHNNESNEPEEANADDE
jgi:hypothetical protein